MAIISTQPIIIQAYETFDVWYLKYIEANNQYLANDATILSLQSLYDMIESANPEALALSITALNTNTGILENNINQLNSDEITLKSVIVNISAKITTQNTLLDTAVATDTGINTAYTSLAALVNSSVTLSTALKASITNNTTLLSAIQIENASILNLLDSNEANFSKLLANTTLCNNAFISLNGNLTNITSYNASTSNTLANAIDIKSTIDTLRASQVLQITTINTSLTGLNADTAIYQSDVQTLVNRKEVIYYNISNLEIYNAQQMIDLIKHGNSLQQRMLALNSTFIEIESRSAANIVNSQTNLTDVLVEKVQSDLIISSYASLNTNIQNIINKNDQSQKLINKLGTYIHVSAPYVEIISIEYKNSKLYVVVGVISLGAESAIRLLLNYKSINEQTNHATANILINSCSNYTFVIPSLSFSEYKISAVAIAQTNVLNDYSTPIQSYSIAHADILDVNSIALFTGSTNTVSSVALKSNILLNMSNISVTNGQVLALNNSASFSVKELAQNINESNFTKCAIIVKVIPEKYNFDFDNSSVSTIRILGKTLSDIGVNDKLWCDSGSIEEKTVISAIQGQITYQIPKINFTYYGKTSPQYLNNKWYLFSDTFLAYYESRGGNRYFTSTDLVNWTEKILGLNSQSNHICYNGITGVMKDKNFGATTILYSDDLDNWTEISVPSPYTCQSNIIYPYNMFIFVDESENSLRYYTSYTGKSWLQRAFPEVFPKCGVAYGMSTYVVPDVSVNGARIFSSLDLITWDVSTGFTVVDTISSLPAYLNGIWFQTINTLGSKRLYKSLDSINWTSLELPATYLGKSSVSFYNGIYFITNGELLNNKIFTSLDGINWNLIIIPGYYTGLTSVSYSNGAYFITDGSINSTSLYRSADGTNWTRITLPSQYQGLSQVSYSNGKYCLASGLVASIDIFSSLDGINWLTTGNYEQTVNYVDCSFATPLANKPSFVSSGNKVIKLSATNSSGSISYQLLNNLAYSRNGNEITLSGYNIINNKYINSLIQLNAGDIITSIAFNLYV